jgi:hypothetical protein
VIPGALPGEPFIVGAAAPGFVAAVATGHLRPDVGEVTVVLGGGAVLAGEVRTFLGEPAEAVEVYASPASSFFLRQAPRAASLGSRSLTRSARTVTDGGGRFEIRGLPAPASLLVRAWGKDHSKVQIEPVEFARETSRVWLDLRLDAPTGVHLRVLDPNGERVARARLKVHDPDGEWIYGDDIPVFTDARGEAAIPLTRSGSHELLIRPLRWRPARREINVERGQFTTIDVHVEPGESLEGHVVDESGRPVANVDVTFAWYQRAFTRADGSFRLEGLEAAPGGLEVSDWSGRYLRWTRKDVLPGNAPLAVVLKASGRVAGRFEPAPPTRRVDFSLRVERSRMGWDVRLARDGSFLLSGMPIGKRFTLIFHPSNGLPVLCEVEAIAGGEQKDLGTLTVRAGRTLVGHVVDQQDRQVADTRITIDDDRFDLERSAISDDEGRFRFEHLPEAPVSITVWIGQSHGRTLDLDDWWAKAVVEIKLDSSLPSNPK